MFFFRASKVKEKTHEKMRIRKVTCVITVGIEWQGVLLAKRVA